MKKSFKIIGHTDDSVKVILCLGKVEKEIHIAKPDDKKTLLNMIDVQLEKMERLLTASITINADVENLTGKEFVIEKTSIMVDGEVDDFDYTEKEVKDA